MEKVKWFVSRDYTKTAPGLGTVCCAVFMTEEDARDYYRLQKRRLATDNKKRSVPRAYEWIWGKEIQTIDEEGCLSLRYEVL